MNTVANLQINDFVKYVLLGEIRRNMLGEVVPPSRRREAMENNDVAQVNEYRRDHCGL